MKHKVIKLIPAYTREVLSHTSCDICKRTDEQHRKAGDGCGLGNVEIEFNDIDMSYPECAAGVMYSYDICDECFKSKVIPMMSDLGAEPRELKWDR